MIDSTLCYIEKNGQYLMLYRNKKKKDVNGHKWVGVGGKFEPGESPEECLVREVYEETGLRLKRWHFYGVIDFISDCWETEHMYLFRGIDYDGEVTEDCNEGELHWIAKEKILELPMWEGDPYFLKPMLAGQNRIGLTLRYEGDRLIEVRENADKESGN